MNFHECLVRTRKLNNRYLFTAFPKIRISFRSSRSERNVSSRKIARPELVVAPRLYLPAYVSFSGRCWERPPKKCVALDPWTWHRRPPRTKHTICSSQFPFKTHLLEHHEILCCRRLPFHRLGFHRHGPSWGFPTGCRCRPLRHVSFCFTRKLDRGRHFLGRISVFLSLLKVGECWSC